MNQIIDVERKGNVIRFYVDKNGKQWGDDWNDAPYEHNAGTVYSEYVQRTVDYAVPFDLYVHEPSDDGINSQYSKEDFIARKVAPITIESSEWGGKTLLAIHYGDDVDATLKALRDVVAKEQLRLKSDKGDN